MLMYRKLSLLILIPALLFFACKKSNSSNASGPLIGTWNFLDLQAQSTVTATSSGITTVTVANYTTQGNGGTATFTSDSLSLVGLTYTINTTAETYLYLAGAVYDSSSVPFTYSVPATNEEAAYKVIGNDSLYFPGGGIVPGAGSGGRWAIKGDTLGISVNGSQTVPGAGLETIVGTFYFVKQ